ncbi:MAG: efflux RND transporter periplasmic adaptor subunit [Planctomycetes bacterium]|nr:efflux RND transporter periplasmic adaptor subunit [Planctomycetota bacterium]
MKPALLRWPLARRLLFVPPVMLGVGVVALLATQREVPQRKGTPEVSRAARVIEVAPVDVAPRVMAHGVARPADIWRAVAEVQGRVIEVHPELAAGGLLERGETLLKIDPTEYELASAQLQADLNQVASQIHELETQRENEQGLLKIEEQSLRTTQQELARLESLHRRSVSDTQLDQQRRVVLAQEHNVKRMENSLKIIPEKIKTLQAVRQIKEAALKQAELNLAKTVLKAPMDCQLGPTQVQVGQFVTAGEVLFEAHGTQVAEIEAQVPPAQVRNLMAPAQSFRLPMTVSTQTVRKALDVEVKVRLRAGDYSAEWKGRFSRLREKMDPQTRTVGLVVAVDRPYEKAVPGQRPPLLAGAFCEVELRGPPRRKRIVIPRSALHGGEVYVVNDEGRLERRPVEVEFAQGDFLCLQSGLTAGETLIVSDITPAIEGMLIEPTLDQELRRAITAEAAGMGEL